MLFYRLYDSLKALDKFCFWQLIATLYCETQLCALPWWQRYSNRTHFFGQSFKLPFQLKFTCLHLWASFWKKPYSVIKNKETESITENTTSNFSRFPTRRGGEYAYRLCLIQGRGILALTDLLHQLSKDSSLGLFDIDFSLDDAKGKGIHDNNINDEADESVYDGSGIYGWWGFRSTL